jgi:hypothetical protein
MVPERDNPDAHDRIEMPAPTVWPMVLSLGLVLLAAGVVTDYALSAVGGGIFVVAIVGWVRELLPGAGVVMEERAATRPQRVVIAPEGVEALRPGMPGYRFQIPEKIHPYSAGAKGGLYGGVAMAVVALLYGVVSGHGIWYPINLLGGMLLPSDQTLTVEQLEKFNLLGLVFGIILHGITSVGVGLIYGVLLPTLPRYPIFWSGLVLPLVWSGGIYGFMGVLNPPMRQHVDWKWFIVSQMAYGITVGLVVMRTEMIYAAKIWRGPGEAAEEIVERTAEGANEGDQ